MSKRNSKTPPMETKSVVMLDSSPIKGTEGEREQSWLDKVFTDRFHYYKGSLAPYMTLMMQDKMTFPDPRSIDTITAAFHAIQKAPNSSGLNTLLKIDKIPKRNSINGYVVVTRMLKLHAQDSMCLLKLPANKRHVDPPSYEYYIGTTMNELRKKGINCFALTYGRLQCGIDLASEKPLCNGPDVSHMLIQEYLGQQGKVLSLSDLISNFEQHIRGSTQKAKVEILEHNVLNIMLLLLLSLQTAQDELDFTHYDLHLENILVMKLTGNQHFVYTYKDKQFHLHLDFFPVIIDMGRCHVKIGKTLDGAFIDIQKNKSFDTIAEMQQHYWSGMKLAKSDADIVKACMEKVILLADDKNVRSKLKSKLTAPASRSATDKDDLLAEIFQKFYMKNPKDPRTLEVDFNVDPRIKNARYDMFRFVMLTCYSMHQSLEKRKIPYTKKCWQGLSNLMESAYPFYIPHWFILSTDYPSFTGKIDKPIDLVNFLYNDMRVAYTNLYTSLDKRKVSRFQMGGARVSSKIENLPILPTKTTNKFMKNGKNEGDSSQNSSEQSTATVFMSKWRQELALLSKTSTSFRKLLDKEFYDYEPKNETVPIEWTTQ
jgi:hypothetical protein